MSSLTHNYYQKNQRDLERERKERKAIGRERDREREREADPDQWFFFVCFGFPARNRRSEKEGVVERKRLSWEVTVRENKERESGYWFELGSLSPNLVWNRVSIFLSFSPEIHKKKTTNLDPPLPSLSLPISLFFLFFLSLNPACFFLVIIGCGWTHLKVWNKVWYGCFLLEGVKIGLYWALWAQDENVCNCASVSAFHTFSEYERSCTHIFSYI